MQGQGGRARCRLRCSALAAPIGEYGPSAGHGPCDKAPAGLAGRSAAAGCRLQALLPPSAREQQRRAQRECVRPAAAAIDGRRSATRHCAASRTRT